MSATQSALSSFPVTAAISRHNVRFQLAPCHTVCCTPRVMLYVARHASHNVRFQLARNHAAVRRCACHTDRRVYANETSNHARVVSKAIAIATLQSPESALRFASLRLADRPARWGWGSSSGTWSRSATARRECSSRPNRTYQWPADVPPGPLNWPGLASACAQTVGSSRIADHTRGRRVAGWRQAATPSP